MNLGSQCRADRPCLERSKSRNRLSKVDARSVLFFPPAQEKDMHGRLHARSSQGMMSPLIPLLALGALLAACHDAERSLAPSGDGPQFSLTGNEGLKGRIAFHSNRDGDFDIYVMNADGTGVTQVTHNTINDFDPIWSSTGEQIESGRTSGGRAAAGVVINADGSDVRVPAPYGFLQA